jgi:hypothetical protein
MTSSDTKQVGATGGTGSYSPTFTPTQDGVQQTVLQWRSQIEQWIAAATNTQYQDVLQVTQQPLQQFGTCFNEFINALQQAYQQQGYQMNRAQPIPQSHLATLGSMRSGGAVAGSSTGTQTSQSGRSGSSVDSPVSSQGDKTKR